MIKHLLFLICFPFQAIGQNTIGLPDIINYTRPVYKAGLQNWDIKQDKNGIIYFANNEGLLCFDGRYWNNYPLPNKTIVRSVEIGPDNRIYAGGQDEIGYFAPQANGQLQYNSLISRIPAKDRSFGDVWDIISYKGRWEETCIICWRSFISLNSLMLSPFSKWRKVIIIGYVF